ncbi:alpha/beta fold hydrolase [Bacillus sp. EB01]|uniref:alpha/beta fold hydrolase n=1 Tax=Bacillus sp. EB01 TaxID=1347086 RepID=UPI0005C74A37|nr:alpha/beta hydrolase [Bacillus sp. EB01]
MNAKSVKVGNTEISYFDNGKGKPIVLLHGFAGSKLYWEKVIPELAAGYRVIAPDFHGHGDSTMGLEKFSIEEMADAIKELLEYTGLQKVTMFGHSMGGYVTLAFAEKYPEMLDGFSLVHSTGSSDSEEAKAGRESNAKKVVEEGLDILIHGLAPKLFSPDNEEHCKDEIDQVKKIGLSTSIKGTVSALLAMKERRDRNDVLENTDLPVLLVAGEYDQVIPPEKTFSVEKPNIEHHLIHGAGHMSMYEEPEELIKVMKQFLEKV